MGRWLGFARGSEARRLRGRRGSASIFSALCFTGLIAVTDLATEYGYCLVLKVSSQRGADTAAYAGAVAYAASGTSAGMAAQVSQIAALNGLASVSASLAASPSGDGNQAVVATVVDTYARQLKTLYGQADSLRPTSQATAEIAGGTPGCVFAMSKSGNGVTLSGGVSATISGCAVQSNVTVTAPCGTSMIVPSITYETTAPVTDPSGCTTISAPAGKTLSVRQVAAVDPVAGTAALTTAEARSYIVGNMSNPAAPNVSGGTALDFGYSPAAVQQALTTAGCTSSFSGSTYTVNCNATGKTYTFGTLTVEGGITLVFNTVSTSTYNAGGLLTGGGTTVTFGGGTFKLGSVSCNGSLFSICAGGTSLAFNGTVNMSLQSGLSVQGGTSVTIGSGSSNSYVFGAGSGGFAMYSSGGAKITLADATGAGDVFQANGNIANGGGSCTVVPAAAQHDINGYVSTAGGTYFGAGAYTVADYVGVGVGGGGDVTCALPSTGSSQEIGFSAANTTWYIMGNQVLANSNCNQSAPTALCVGAGYANVVITAPAGGSVANLAVVSTTGGAAFSEGATNTTIEGVLYTPNSLITLSGAANVSGGNASGTSGACLELVGSSITLSGGSALASTCPGFAGGTTSATSRLVN